MKTVRKIILILIGIAMICVMALSVAAEEQPNSAFDEWMKEEYIEAMESDYMTMHFGIRNYRALGIEKPEPVIGSAKWEDYEEGVREGKETLQQLESFDYNSLSESQKHDYDTYHFYLERIIELNSYPYFDWWFTPSEGLIDNLPTNFTEFVFYEKEDIDDYLSVLESVYDYIMGALEITRIQAEAGYFMTDSALDSTLEAIDKFVKRTDDNPLIVIFEENIDAFEGLSEAERSSYKQRNREILYNSYIPAYQKAAEELEKYRGTRSDDEPIAKLKDGSEYYAARIRYKASSSKTAQELVDLCGAYINEEIDNYIDLVYSVGISAELDESISMSDPTEILKYHQEHMSVYPEGPTVTYKASYLDPAVASDGIVAYYMEPPVDLITDNVIKINGDNVSDTNELYSTLAHEGFPGHLYQITWYLNTDPNLMRTAISNIGYTEGWAMYTEDNAWSYSPLSEAAAEYNRINTSLGYAMNALADLGVNGLGWSESDLAAYLTAAGLNEEVAPDLYEFVMDTPGVIIPYGAGLAQFMTIRDDAMNTLGSQFDLTEFNTVLLTYGDRPFEIVEADVKAWVDTYDLSKSEYPEPNKKKRSVSPLIYVGGGVMIVVLGALGIILIRNSRKRNPFA